MARPERIELPTPSLGNLCSIQLSYERQRRAHDTKNMITAPTIAKSSIL